MRIYRYCPHLMGMFDGLLVAWVVGRDRMTYDVIRGSVRVRLYEYE
jgi:hypothetical protein